jgi:hypothetical protein
MDGIRRLDRKAYGEIQKFFMELEKTADLGSAMHAEWEGCRRAHVLNDLYRVIWQDMPEIEDYEGGADDTVVPVVVLRVGSKAPPGGGTIYQEPRPSAE